MMSIAYFNDIYTAPGEESVAILTLTPTVTWTSGGNDVTYNPVPSWGARLRGAEEATNRYRYGIRILFDTRQGKIFRPDPIQFVTALAQGIVMLRVAKKIATLVAKFLLGPSSKLYNAAIDEVLSFPKAMARFTCQALIADSVFGFLDSDAGGTISRDELQQHLKVFLDNLITDKDVFNLSSLLKDKIEKIKT